MSKATHALLLTAASVTLAGTTLAATGGKITLVGNGSAAHAPEIARLTLTVDSKCYDTADHAKEANAALAAKLVSDLQTYGPDVTAAGGPTTFEAQTLGSDYHTVICENSWSTSNVLTIKTKDLAHLVELEDRLIQEITAAGQSELSDTKARTTANLSQPSFDLTKETKTQLEAQAVNETYRNARAQADALAQQCGIKNIHLTSVSPPTYQLQANAGNYAPSFPGGGVSTPLIPESISVTSQLTFEWSYEDSGNCLQ